MTEHFFACPEHSHAPGRGFSQAPVALQWAREASKATESVTPSGAPWRAA
jgi:hypothetical protein